MSRDLFVIVRRWRPLSVAGARVGGSTIQSRIQKCKQTHVVQVNMLWSKADVGQIKQIRIKSNKGYYRLLLQNSQNHKLGQIFSVNRKIQNGQKLVK